MFFVGIQDLPDVIYKRRRGKRFPGLADFVRIQNVLDLLYNGFRSLLFLQPNGLIRIQHAPDLLYKGLRLHPFPRLDSLIRIQHTPDLLYKGLRLHLFFRLNGLIRIQYTPDLLYKEFRPLRFLRLNGLVRIQHAPDLLCDEFRLHLFFRLNGLVCIQNALDLPYKEDQLHVLPGLTGFLQFQNVLDFSQQQKRLGSLRRLRGTAPAHAFHRFSQFPDDPHAFVGLRGCRFFVCIQDLFHFIYKRRRLYASPSLTGFVRAQDAFDLLYEEFRRSEILLPLSKGTAFFLQKTFRPQRQQKYFRFIAFLQKPFQQLLRPCLTKRVPILPLQFLFIQQKSKDLLRRPVQNLCLFPKRDLCKLPGPVCQRSAVLLLRERLSDQFLADHRYFLVSRLCFGRFQLRKQSCHFCLFPDTEFCSGISAQIPLQPFFQLLKLLLYLHKLNLLILFGQIPDQILGLFSL